ncbi:MAG: hypothetical protein ACR2HD_10630 [Solirubrobacteraceae bacterium]|nr:MAG: hypothetical protein DLM63_07030 [Solirubrobacterales bacterium]
MTRKDIRTTQAAIACDVCGRRLLRGEHPDVYLVGGTRRDVCELCITRAEHEGWIREEEGGALGARRQPANGRRSLLARLRRRGERNGNEPPQAAAVDPSVEPDDDAHDAQRYPPAAAETRHVHAVPANDEMKLARAVDVFNNSGQTRTVAGIARSLGAPSVAVRTRGDRPSVVSMVIAWELSWYRYEVDLANEAAGVRLAAQGTELAELGPDEQSPNAVADTEGAVALAA